MKTNNINKLSDKQLKGITGGTQSFFLGSSNSEIAGQQMQTATLYQKIEVIWKLGNKEWEDDWNGQIM